MYGPMLMQMTDPPKKKPQASGIGQALMGLAQRDATAQARNSVVGSTPFGIPEMQATARALLGVPSREEYAAMSPIDQVMAQAKAFAGTTQNVAGKFGKVAKALPVDEASRMARARQLGFNVDEPLYHGTSRSFDEFIVGDEAAKGKQAGLQPTNSPDAKLGVFMSTNPKVSEGFAKEAAHNWRMDDFGEFDQAIPMVKKGIGDYIEKNLGITNRHDFREFMQAARAGAAGEHYDVVRNWLGIKPQGESIYPLVARGKYKELDFAGGSTKGKGQFIANAAEKAKAEGYDGLRLVNVDDSVDFTGELGTSVMTFDPANIRSKFAKFDPKNIGKANLLGGGVGAALMAQTYNKNKER
jgi:hypothetical protein